MQEICNNTFKKILNCLPCIKRNDDESLHCAEDEELFFKNDEGQKVNFKVLKEDIFKDKDHEDKLIDLSSANEKTLHRTPGMR